MSDAKPRMGSALKLLSATATNGLLAADEIPGSIRFLCAVRDDEKTSERDRIQATRTLATLLKISVDAAQTVYAAERADEGKSSGNVHHTFDVQFAETRGGDA